MSKRETVGTVIRYKSAKMRYSNLKHCECAAKREFVSSWRQRTYRNATKVCHVRVVAAAFMAGRLGAD